MKGLNALMLYSLFLFFEEPLLLHEQSIGSLTYYMTELLSLFLFLSNFSGFENSVRGSYSPLKSIREVEEFELLYMFGH